MLLDDFLPHYQFNEVHSIRVHAPIQRVYQAFKDLQPMEISRWVDIISEIRELPARIVGKSTPGMVENRPFLEQMVNGDFFTLGEEPPKEYVFGFIGKFWKLTDCEFVRFTNPEEFITYHQPENAKSAVNFMLVEEPNGTVKVTTETRINVPDPTARRKFALYWSVVSLGAGLIRVFWLQAVKRRAERGMVSVVGA